MTRVLKNNDYSWLIGTAITILCIVASSFLIFGQSKQQLADTVELARDNKACIKEIEDTITRDRETQNKAIRDLTSMIHKLDITLTKLESKLE